MRLEDIRKALVVNDFAPKERTEPYCAMLGCVGPGVVPDGGIMYCPDHHFRCNTAIEGGDCLGRVGKLGMICVACDRANRKPRKKRHGGRRR